MNNTFWSRPRTRVLLLGALLVAAVLMRLHHFQAPLLDQLYVKQVHVANHARNIARNVWNPLRFTMDFLDEQGRAMVLTEEFPLYNGLVGASYHLLGEHEWLGRVWSLLGTLVAIVAVYDLFKREYDEPTGFVAAFLFAMTPLLLFYGRGVLPDPWMVACMVLSAGFYRRYLDEGKTRWLAAAAGAGLFAALFKFFGLVVLIPLADMTYRRGGWRAWFSRSFIVLGAVMTVPVALWIAAVFLQIPNTSSRTAYFFWQAPEWLWSPRLYERLTLGLLVKDSGPLAGALIVWGLLGSALGRERSRPLWGWSALGLFYWFLFAPKMVDHDYYALPILPVLAAWAALGWRLASRRSAWLGAAVLVLAAVVHSPWIMSSKYDLELGHLVVAERLKELCPPGSRIVVLGQKIGWPEVHYSGRQGWVEQYDVLPSDWRETFQKYRGYGAEYAAVYFDPTVTANQRASFEPLLSGLPVVEHRSGPWFRRGRPCEYYILSLRDLSTDIAAAPAERR